MLKALLNKTKSTTLVIALTIIINAREEPRVFFYSSMLMTSTYKDENYTCVSVAINRQDGANG